MADAGIPVEDDVNTPNNTSVFSFPVKAPEGALTRADLTAVEHLDIWKIYQNNFCEHKPSVTISIRDNEYPAVQAWIWDEFSNMSGVAFLPYSDHSYKQAPYTECTRREYEDMLSKMPPSIDWQKLSAYEFEDTTVGMQTLACSGDVYEVVDLV